MRGVVGFVNFFLLIGLVSGLLSSPATAQTLPQTDICQSVVEIPTQECEALVSLYTATNGDQWNEAGGWLLEINPSDWYGVTVEDGHVSKLSLPGNSLQGGLPAQIGALTHLTELNLRDNQLSGVLPAEIGNLSQLVILDLSNNQFSGGLPAGLFDLITLQYLYLDQNQFGGVLSAEVGNLTGLTVLWLNDNQLVGFPPASLTNLTALLDPGLLQPGDLDGLDLNNNRFCVPDNYPQSGNDLHQFLNQKDPDFHLHQTCTPFFEVVLPLVRR